MAGVEMLQEPSEKLKKFLCPRKEASVEADEEDEEEVEEEFEEEAGQEVKLLADQDAVLPQEEKTSTALLTKWRLQDQHVVSSLTGLTGVLGAFYFLGWWPTAQNMQKTI